MSLNKKEVNYQYLLILFLIAHLVVWTLVNITSRYTVNGDTVEAFNWGMNLNFGYDKNPYMPGWIAYLAMFISSSVKNAWGYYLIQQGFVCLGLLGIWQFAKRIMSKERALASVLLMEGCLYFNAYVQSNNDNYILIGILPWLVYFFHKLCFDHKFRPLDAVLLGLCAGLAVMTKYSIGIFFLSMLIYVVITPRVLKNIVYQWKHILIALITFLIVVLPNLYYLATHDFITIQYIFHRSEEITTGFKTNVLNVGNFIWMTMCNFIPTILLFLLCRPICIIKHPESRRFLIFIGILPFTIVLLYFLLSGSKGYWEWGVPFVVFASVLMCSFVKLKLNIRVLFAATIFLILAGGLANYIINAYVGAGKGSGDYPASGIAKYSEDIWQSHTDKPFLYVAGSRYSAGYVSYYSSLHPKLYAEWNALYSPGINDCLIKKYGAVFIHGNGYGTTVEPLPADYSVNGQFPKEIIQRFPQLIVVGQKTFNFHRNQKTHATETLLFGIVKPDNSYICQ